MKPDRSALKRRLITAACFICCVILYYIYHARVRITSDTVTTLPMAADLLRGNIILRGWILGTNNFYLTEIVPYAIGKLILPDGILIALIPSIAMAATLFLLISLLEIKELSPAGQAVFITVLFCIVGVFPYDAAYTLLNANSHNNLYAMEMLLLALVVLYRKKGNVPLAILIFIAETLLVFSEGVTTMVLIAPLAAVSLWEFLFERKREDLSLLVINVCAFIAGKLVLTGVERIGGVKTVGMAMHIVKNPQDLLQRIKEWIPQCMVLLKGYNVDLSTRPSCKFLVDLFLITMVIEIVRFFMRKTGYFEGLLLVISGANLSGCLFTSVPVFHRYLVPAFIFGYALSALLLAKLTALIEGKLTSAKKFPKFCIYIPAALVIIAFLYFPARRIPEIASKPVYGEAEREAAAVLAGLEGDGYGDFWAASLLEYYCHESGAAPDLRCYPVRVSDDAVSIAPYEELVSTAWYAESGIHWIVRYNNGLWTSVRDDHFMDICGQPDESYTVNDFSIFWYKEDLSNYLDAGDMLPDGGAAPEMEYANG